MNPDLPPVLDPAYAWRTFTLLHANGTPMIDPRTSKPWRFASRRAARQQAIVLKQPTFRIAGLR